METDARQLRAERLDREGAYGRCFVLANLQQGGGGGERMASVGLTLGRRRE